MNSSIENSTTQESIPNWTSANKKNNPLYAFKGVKINKEGHTWRKYQKLHNHIFKKCDNKKINFQEIFLLQK